jgi:uncharacterized protein YoxC
VLVAVAAFLVGLFGSVWNDAIKDAFPFCCWLDFKDTLHWHSWTPHKAVYVFWASAFAWLVFFIFRQLSESKSIELLQKSAGNIALEVGSVHEQVGEITTNVGTLKESTQKVVSEVSSVQSGVKEVTVSVGIVKENAQQIVRDVNSVNSRVNEVTASASEIKKDTGEVRKNLDEAKTSAAALQSAVNDVTGQISKIGEDLQTLPPPNFRQQLIIASDAVYKLLNQGWPRRANASQRRQLTESICSMLEHIALMVAQYESKDQGAHGADIMLFWKASSLTGDELAKSSEYLDLHFSDADVVGYLVTDETLHASTRPESSRETALRLREGGLVFPIPEKYKCGTENSRKVPPVAPVAFASGSFFGWPDTSTFSTPELKEKFILDNGVITALENFYKGEYGSRMKSIYSFPLMFPRAELHAFGTLNVYCNEANIFKNRAQATIFTTVAQPIINQIAEACYLRRSLGRKPQI